MKRIWIAALVALPLGLLCFAIGTRAQAAQVEARRAYSEAKSARAAAQCEAKKACEAVSVARAAAQADGACAKTKALCKARGKLNKDLASLNELDVEGLDVASRQVAEVLAQLGRHEAMAVHVANQGHIQEALEAAMEACAEAQADAECADEEAVQEELEDARDLEDEIGEEASRQVAEALAQLGRHEALTAHVMSQGELQRVLEQARAACAAAQADAECAEAETLQDAEEESEDARDHEGDEDEDGEIASRYLAQSLAQLGRSEETRKDASEYPLLLARVHQSQSLEDRVHALEQRLGIDGARAGSLEERVAALERRTEQSGPMTYMLPGQYVLQPGALDRFRTVERDRGRGAPRAVRVRPRQAPRALETPAPPTPETWDDLEIPPVAETTPELPSPAAPPTPPESMKRERRAEIESHMQSMRDQMERLRSEMQRLQEEMGAARARRPGARGGAR